VWGWREEDETMLADAVKAEAQRLGFDLVGIVAAQRPPGLDALDAWIEHGYAGEMAYVQRRRDAYTHPSSVLEGVRSLIMVAVNYKPATGRPEPGVNQGCVSCYAWGQRDYHDVVQDKLSQLADFLHTRRPGCRTRCVVDTAPLLERSFAQRAGLGWIGKNTMLIHKRLGSWLFLGALLVDLALEEDAPFATGHCGTCTRCLDACPTQAFPEPDVLDARKCLSYLTIELRNEPVPIELREGITKRLFGCDICQQVCPWNHKAPAGREPAFAPTEDLAPADAMAWLSLSDEDVRQRFQRTALWRARRAVLLRNAAIVLGNHGDVRAVPALLEALDDAEPLVRGASAWALGRLRTVEALAALQSRQHCEDNAIVQDEIAGAIRGIRHEEGGAVGNVNGQRAQE